MRTRYIFLLLLFMLPATLPAQWIEDEKINALIDAGIQDTYSMRFEKADAAFRSVVQKYPEHPAGHFLLAMVEWWRILIDIENETRDDRFHDMLDRVIDLCDRRLDRDERDIAGLFFKGGAIGFQGRLHANRKSWVSAATRGKEALPVVMDAAELAPDNADLAFGTGIYDYYAAVLPERYSVLKPLMMFLPEGDRARGIRGLKHAAEKGRFANWEAMYFLLQINYSMENRPSTALKYARKLRAQFPENPVFHRYLGRTYIKLGNWARAAQVFADIHAAAQKEKRGYSARMQREASYYLGYAALIGKNPGEAIRHFVECDRLSRSLDEEPSGFMIMANLRMGMAHDMMAQRKYAIKQYEKVLRMPDYSGSHDIAARHRKTPYSH
ncbi:MAG: tetratricopeptide repeat protein [Bacteroidota bacterium]|nr:tetratricopeptide repeat protein [Bacteroidota bacterium]